jgi:hypothetical protein
VNPPEASDDAPSDASDQSYERIFTELFSRFWRGARAEAPLETGEPDPPTQD